MRTGYCISCREGKEGEVGLVFVARLLPGRLKRAHWLFSACVCECDEGQLFLLVLFPFLSSVDVSVSRWTYVMAISRGAWCSVRILSRKVTLNILSSLICDEGIYLTSIEEFSNRTYYILWKLSFCCFASEKQLRTPGLMTSPFPSTILSPQFVN